MIFLFLCFTILIYAIYQYNSGKKDKSTFVFFLFLCDGFGFFHSDWLSGMPINKYRDFALLYMIYVATSQWYNSKKIIIPKFPIYKWLSILTIYLTAEFVFTVSTGKESFGLSLAVYRNYLFFFSFTLFRELKSQQLRNVIVKVSFMTLIAAFVYITQPLHQLKILDGATSGEIVEGVGVRYRNIPELLYFILIYVTVRLNFSKLKSVVLISLCGMCLVLSQHRGVMLGYAVTILIFLLLSRDAKKTIQYVLISIVGFFAVGSMVISRFENKGQISTMDDIANVFDMDYSRAAAGGYDDEGGTLAFRILLFVERFDYFKKHPQYMLTGVGMRHEDSPRTKEEFNFVLGSRKLNQQTGYWVPQQIDSDDLVWFTPFMKFGTIGLFLYLYITFLTVTYLLRNRNNGTLAKVIFLYYVMLMIISMKNNMLFAPIQISFLLMLIELMKRTNSQLLIDKIKYQEFKLLGKKVI